MSVDDRSWGPLFIMRGPAPVGEIEVVCPGCRTRFLSGQLAVPRTLHMPNVGMIHVGFSAHIECTARVEELERAT